MSCLWLLTSFELFQLYYRWTVTCGPPDRCLALFLRMHMSPGEREANETSYSAAART